MDRAQLSLGAPDDGYMVWRPYLAEKTRFYGQLSLGYTHNPLRNTSSTFNEDVADRFGNLIKGQAMTYLSIGTEVSGWFSFNISQPIALYTFYGGLPERRLSPHLQHRRQDGHPRYSRRPARRAYQSNDRQTRLGAGVALFLPYRRQLAPSLATTEPAPTFTCRVNITSAASARR